MKKTTIAVLLASGLLIAGCAQVLNGLPGYGISLPLGQTEAGKGLREALAVGAQAAAGQLGTAGGYYRNEALRILLPEQANIIVQNISKLPGGSRMVDDVITRINRSAEDAAAEAAPIFVDSISRLTIRDALAILHGEDNAATRYLRTTTFDQLFELYLPRIQDSLDKKLLGTVSTNASWNMLTGQWNRLAGSLAGRLAGLQPVDLALDRYLTGKALNGLFLTIEQEELKIRTDPLARVTPLLQRVFGRLDSSN